ncbi:MAG TPA: redoxin domain-containing protein [Thermoanaerobaculia bacterium]|jgi:peroxiredoxin|nr:redoxin domain-containing protein [Thermoanaerobaculia bacterium]
MGYETALVMALVALGLVVIGQTAFLYQLIKQQGRLVMRLDQVERDLGLNPEDAVERGTVAIQARQPSGLPVGTVLPNFELPDLDDQPVSLQDFRGKRVLLVNWSARCGFCDLIAPDLARAEADLERANVKMLLVSHGTAEAERKLAEEHGLKSPILLAMGSAGLEAFETVGTPAAYLLDEEGKVAQPLAIGAERVPALVAGLLPGEKAEKRTRLPGERPLSESRIERDGLKAGTPAPNFTLPEVRGGTVSLDQYRGRKVLLVFSDPHCGPCDELAPHLARLQEEHRSNGLDLLMVGRGDPGENRKKVEKFGFEFPVGLQRRWEVSKQYGIFSIPAGFLIDEQGVIADVAKGVDQIPALASKLPDIGKEVQHG